MIRGIWDRETVALLLLAAALPIAAAWLWYGGLEALGRLALALLVAGAWHVAFMLARAQPPSLAGVLTALAVAILAPVDLGLFPFVLGVSFGTVVAELIFGGWGRNVLNPATVTLAFLGFGFPAAAWPDLVAPVGWAAIPAAALGVLTGVISGRIVAGAALALAGAALAGLPVVAAPQPLGAGAGPARLRPGGQRHHRARALAERAALRPARRALRGRLAGRGAVAASHLRGALHLARRAPFGRDRHRALARAAKEEPWLT